VPTITLSGDAAHTLAADVLVVGVTQAAKGLALAGADAVGPLRGLAGTLAEVGATGKAEELTRIPAPSGVVARVLVAVGLGEQQRRYDPETLRRAAGAAARSLAGSRRAALALPARDAAEVEAVATGALLGGYTFTRFRDRTVDSVKPAVRALVLVTPTLAAGGSDRSAARAAVARARAVTDAMCLTRDLVNTPPNALTPAAFADVATQQARAAGLGVRVWDEKALRRGGFGGIVGVGQGSDNPPRLVRLEYRHRAPVARLAIVGKGITFDSGGISIKPAAGMDAMKSDMGGAAAVLAALTAIARLKPAVTVTGWLPLAENMPGGAAQRPSDVLTIYGGRTVEVLNTDAEGRLILADAIVAAAEDGPDAIIDVATLTGAARIALGVRTAGLMSNDERFRGQLHAAATRAGEAMWPMPLPDELRRGLDSQVADIANIDPARVGGMLSAGCFLREFVPDGVRWAHIDIAGPAYNDGAPFGYTPKGGTGIAVRTLVQVAEDLAAGRLDAT
jgi:leucyl aminopeptidase